MTPEERFLAKVAVDAETGCWIWTAYRIPRAPGKLEYGVFRTSEGTALAHRWAYEHWVGPIPEGKQLDHYVCDTPPCVNPAHLRPVTARENALRGETIAAQNAAKTHCPRGHEYTEDNIRWTTTLGRQCIACEKIRVRKRSAA